MHEGLPVPSLQGATDGPRTPQSEKSLVRWNSDATVLRCKKPKPTGTPNGDNTNNNRCRWIWLVSDNVDDQTRIVIPTSDPATVAEKVKQSWYAVQTSQSGGVHKYINKVEGLRGLLSSSVVQ